MTGWTRRVRRPPGPQELQALRDAAQEIAQQSGRAPGKARVVFQTVADVALIGTAVISGALASIHLYKALFPKLPREDHRERSPESAGADREPPRCRHLATAAGERARSG